MVLISNNFLSSYLIVIDKCSSYPSSEKILFAVDVLIQQLTIGQKKKKKQRIRVCECSEINGTSESHPFHPRLRKHYFRRDRKIVTVSSGGRPLQNCVPAMS